MKVDMVGQGYWYDDVKFRKEDKLMTVNQLMGWVGDDCSKAAQLCALGCLVQHIVYQGDEAQDFDLYADGDARSDWVKLYKGTGEIKMSKVGKPMRTSMKEVDFVQAFDLLLAACSLLDADAEPHVLGRLADAEPNLYKCLVAGMCAKLDQAGISVLTAVPGTDKMASKILQLRM